MDTNKPNCSHQNILGQNVMAQKDFKAIEIAIKGGATREQAIEQLAASKAAIETNEEEV